MLVNAIEMLKKAKEEKYAVAHFNINNLEWTKYILEECQKLNSPVILGVSEGAIKYMGGYNTVTMMVNGLLKDLNITIPVALHLDHGSSVESCKMAIDSGFSSVMIDASKYSLEENIKKTLEVVKYAKSKNVSIEAEIGHIGEEESGVSEELAYVKVEDAIVFAEKANVDFLAPALGSVHGLYKGTPKLDFDRMLLISEKTNLPLVLHGGTGIPDDLLKKGISCGICKLNINTELQVVWSKAVREFLDNNKIVYDPRKIIKSGESAIKDTIRHKLEILGSINKA